MTHKLVFVALGLSMLAAVPLAHAATQAGGMKPRPAHGYVAVPAMERFKDRQEVAYENSTPAYNEASSEIKGHAYGDQVNELPAKERFYDYGRNGQTMGEHPRVRYRTR